jgi:hypothetical protein
MYFRHKYKVVDRTRLSHKKTMAGTTDGGGALATKDDVASSPDRNKEKTYEPKGDELPPWFVQEENGHNTQQRPITKEEVEEMKAKLRQLNERSIKKVSDAESRTKLRTAKATTPSEAAEDQQPDQHVAATAGEVVESKGNGKLRRRRAKKTKTTTKNALHE